MKGRIKTSAVSSLDFEKFLKVITYNLILIFKLRHGNFNSKKLAIFFSSCHFLRQIRQFIHKKLFCAEEIPRELIQKILQVHGKYTSDLDIDNIFIVGDECLPSATNQPKWILVQTEKMYRWVAVSALPIKNMGDRCFASPQLIYNLFLKNYQSSGSLLAHIFPETIQTCCSSHAKSASIALINSTAQDDDLNQKLKAHFTHPKYVQINDLIKIDNSCSFIVKSVEVPKGGRRNAGFFLEHGQSSLFQVRGETSQTFPINLKLRKSTCKINLETYKEVQDCIISIKPSGLNFKFNQDLQWLLKIYWISGLLDHCEILQRSIAPHLMRDQMLGKPYDTLPSFLLSGTSGSGKRIVVKSVADSLGLQIVEVSCLSLIGDSTKASELRIQNAFQSARQVSPAFLYLTDIEVSHSSLFSLPEKI